MSCLRAATAAAVRQNFVRNYRGFRKISVLYCIVSPRGEGAGLHLPVGESMQHILILTGRFGMGHCSAAEAIRGELAARDPQAKIAVVDLIDELFPRSSGVIYRLFSRMVTRCSALYNVLNRAAGHCGVLPQRFLTRKMDALLRRHPADLVISTLPICSQCISAYKQQRGASLPLYTYITDIRAQREWIVPHTDCYFVGSAETARDLRAGGVPDERIHICGIPVRQDFRKPAAAVSSGRLELLIMGGGLGLIPSFDTFVSALSEIPSVHLTIITGKNRALFRRLCAQYPSVSVVGCTGRVADYMRRADLLITKPGGITTFEAIHCGTPLYIIRPFLMQEIGNAQFIERQRIGRVLWQSDCHAANDILSLLYDRAQLQQMKRRMAQLRAELHEPCPDAFFSKGGCAS